MDTNLQYFFDCLCRTCMNKVEPISYDGTTKPQQQWLSIFDIIEESGALRIVDLLSHTVHQIEVQLSDELPKKICSECLQQLLSAHKFQQRCVQSEKQMLELLSKKQTDLTEVVTKGEVEKNNADSYPLKNLPCSSSTLLNLQHSPIQEPLLITTAQSNDADHFQNSDQLPEYCNDSQSEFENFVINEPIQDDNPNTEYSDGDTKHSTNSVTKEEPIEAEEDQVNVTSSQHNCHLCNKSYKRREYLTRHLNNHKRKANSKEHCYACHLCIESYREQRYLSKHLKQVHSIGPQGYPCDFCNKSFPTPSMLRRHIPIHTVKRRYSCPECGESFSQQSSLAEHRKTHSKDKPYECPYCPLRFDSKSRMTNHKIIHEVAKPHKCDICGKRFNRKSQVISHKLMHSGEKPHKCDFCEKRFSRRYHLLIHIRLHTGEKPHKCKYCGLTVSTNLALRRHLRIHLGKNIHRCTFCPLTFPLDSEMRLHITTHKNEDTETRERNLKALIEEEAQLVLKFSKEKPEGQSIEEQQQQGNKKIEQPSTDILEEQRTTHTEDKPYECSYCPLRFTLRSGVSRHKTIHEGFKRHKCGICGKKFRLQSDLFRHKRIHSKEKPHKCHLCEKRFAHIQQLQIHIRFHTGEKPYRCKYCERGFAARSILSKHLRIHLGKNVYRCKLCPLAFPLDSEMRLHLTKHKNEDPEMRERNMKALKEEEAKLKQKFSNEKTQLQSKKEQHQLPSYSRMYPHLTTHTNEDPEMRDPNLKALMEEKANLELKLSREKTEKQPTEKQQHRKLSDKEIEQPSTERDEFREILKNEHIEDDKSNTEYSDSDTMHSTIFVTKGESLPIKSEDQQVNEIRDEFGEFIKNEPIEDDKSNTEYSDSDTMHSTIFVTKGESLPIESEDQQVNEIRDEFREFIKNEPIEDDKSNTEYSDSDTRHSTVSVIKYELIETENQQVNEASSRHDCHLCNKSYKKREYLRRHLNLHKATPKEYCHACHMCGESFNALCYLTRHLKKMHSIESQGYPCDICNKSFKAPSFLRRHIRIHTGERPFSCTECGKSFNQDSGLRAHRQTHSVDKPGNKSYECPRCPLRFCTKTGLVRHKVFHEEVEGHDCDICGKSFKLKSSLTIHKKYHSEERPHKCHLCEKRFVRSQELEIHIRTHTGEKPYKCKYCERRFISASVLKQHLRSHLGNNIYRCKFCPLAFPLASEMRLHLTTHKNEDTETRERNLKALHEEEANLDLKYSKKDIEQPSTE